jgi:hypothetical protein
MNAKWGQFTSNTRTTMPPAITRAARTARLRMSASAAAPAPGVPWLVAGQMEAGGAFPNAAR